MQEGFYLILHFALNENSAGMWGGPLPALLQGYQAENLNMGGTCCSALAARYRDNGLTCGIRNPLILYFYDI